MSHPDLVLLDRINSYAVEGRGEGTEDVVEGELNVGEDEVEFEVV